MNDKEIDSLFKQSLKNMETPVPEDIWSNIETELNLREKKSFSLRKNKAKYAIAASLTAFLCLSIFLYKLMHPYDDVTKNKLTAHYDVQKPVNLDKGLETDHNRGTMKEKQPTIDPYTSSNSESSSETGHYKLTSQTDRSQPIEKLHIEKTKNPEHTDPPVNIFQANMGDHMLTLSEEAKASLPEIEFETADITIAPIKPLIQLPEQEDIMYARNLESPKKSLVTRILNTISENLVSKSGTSLEFSNDEEGTIKIDIINSLARNRTPKGSK